jgi:hypothetical protein
MTVEWSLSRFRNGSRMRRLHQVPVRGTSEGDNRSHHHLSGGASLPVG